MVRSTPEVLGYVHKPWFCTEAPEGNGDWIWDELRVPGGSNRMISRPPLSVAVDSVPRRRRPSRGVNPDRFKLVMR